MMVFGMRAGPQNYGWLLVVVGTISVYVWGPLWPHAVARLPLWSWLPMFSVTVVLAAFYLRKCSSAGFILLGATVITMYFYLGTLLSALISDAIRGRFMPLEGYFAIPILNVLIHLPVIATFAALEA